MTLLFQTAAEPAEATTAYDSVWAGTEAPARQAGGFERTMLAEDKLYVVLGVVLLIWAGLVLFLLRTDRKLATLERSLENGVLADKVEG